jgi:hypothetical protein
MGSARATHCELHTAHDKSGLKFTPYTYVVFTGNVTEEGTVLRGTEGQGARAGTEQGDWALSTATPKNCIR